MPTASLPFLEDTRAAQQGFVHTRADADSARPGQDHPSSCSTITATATTHTRSRPRSALSEKKKSAAHRARFVPTPRSRALWLSRGDTEPANKLILDQPQMTHEYRTTPIAVHARAHAGLWAATPRATGIGVMTDARWRRSSTSWAGPACNAPTSDYKRGYTLQCRQAPGMASNREATMLVNRRRCCGGSGIP